jgi:hypothetical protein
VSAGLALLAAFASIAFMLQAPQTFNVQDFHPGNARYQLLVGCISGLSVIGGVASQFVFIRRAIRVKAKT